MVADLKDLEEYPYGGHSVLLGRHKRNFQEIDYVLRLFGEKEAAARRNYGEYVRKRMGSGQRHELAGGGLLRSSGGWGVLKAMSKARIHRKGDERILGDSDFVKKVLAEQKKRLERRYWLQAQGYDIDRVVEKVAKVFEMEPAEVRKPGNQPLRVKARSLVCYWAVRKLGMNGTSVAQVRQFRSRLGVIRGLGDFCGHYSFCSISFPR